MYSIEDFMQRTMQEYPGHAQHDPAQLAFLPAVPSDLYDFIAHGGIPCYSGNIYAEYVHKALPAVYIHLDPFIVSYVRHGRVHFPEVFRIPNEPFFVGEPALSVYYAERNEWNEENSYVGIHMFLLPKMKRRRLF